MTEQVKGLSEQIAALKSNMTDDDKVLKLEARMESLETSVTKLDAKLEAKLDAIMSAMGLSEIPHPPIAEP